jgi:Sulfatase
MPKHLIVIVLDTLRHPDFFPALADGTAMPFFEGLRRSGVDFSHAVASSCWTPPSHVSLLSGTEPWATHFHIASGTTEVPQNPFLADLWRKRGGQSVGFSANWLVAPEVGTARGYDEFNPGFPTWLSSLVLRGIQVVGFEQLMYARIARRASAPVDRSESVLDGLLQFGGTAAHRAVRPVYAGEHLARSLGRYLKRKGTAAATHLFVNLMEMHEPYDVPPDHRSTGLDLTYLPSVNLARHTQVLSHWGTGLDMMRPYREAAARLDHALSLVFDRLRASGLLDDAAVLVASDHGQGLGEHDGFFGHAFYLYDELVRIPAVYLEFEHGQPRRSAPRIDSWVDLRHLFDLVVARGIEGRDDPPERILKESVSRRGPPASFWEGPGPHPPRGFLLSAPVSSYHRSVRVLNEDGAVSLGDDGIVHYDGALSRPPDELVAYAERSVGRTAEKGVLPSGRRDPEVDRRLKSWGYD